MGISRDAESFVTFTTLDGEDVRVEIEPSHDDFMPVSAERSIGRVERMFRPALTVAGEAIREARELRPDEVTVRLGIKVTGAGGAVISKSVNDCHFEITLSWGRIQG
ncbi:CU044_2847 family protein [Streptomyces sp. NPDC002265]|uniref:CU044_2847 family protein n=1 Tax=Streptomyces sp. NPDC002265 TaxID=3154415 RepID=UPI003324440C